MLISDAIGWFFLVTMVIVAVLGVALVDAGSRPSLLVAGSAKPRVHGPVPPRPGFAPPTA
jgi:hypothetical protein